MKTTTPKLKPITLDELAAIYRKKTGNSAKARPIGEVVDWAVKQTHLFAADKDDNLCLIIK